MLNFSITSPQVRVTFYPQTEANLGRTITAFNHADRADALISVQTEKSLSQPVGHFTVMLAPDNALVSDNLKEQFSYRDILHPGDTVLIEMGPDRPQPDSDYQKLVVASKYSGLEPVMVGSIDSIQESVQFNPQDGRPQRTITVTGRDLAKYLVDDQIWFDSWAEPEHALLGLAPEIDNWLKSGKEKGGKAEGLIRLLLHWLGEHFDVRLRTQGDKDYRLFRDILRYKLTTESPSVASPFNLLSYQGAPWALMERSASPPLYNLVCDTRRQLDITLLLDGTGSNFTDNGQRYLFNTQFGKWDAQAALLFYRNPWPNRYYDDWFNLPLRIVRDEDVIAMELGRNNEEVSNTWRVWSESQGAYRSQGGGDMADARLLRDIDSIRRYGQRPLVISTPFISGFGDGLQKEIVKQFSFKLKDWMRWNEWFLKGRITMKGMAAAKVGDRLWHWDSEFGSVGGAAGFVGGADYYIEEVTQEFRCFTGWTTTVGVGRGQRHRDRQKPLDFTDLSFNGEADFRTDSAVRRRLDRQNDQIRLWGLGGT